jgi:hypothetical protein
VMLISENFDLSVTTPMSSCTGWHATVLGGMRWCVMVPPNVSAVTVNLTQLDVFVLMRPYTYFWLTKEIAGSIRG